MTSYSPSFAGVTKAMTSASRHTRGTAAECERERHEDDGGDRRRHEPHGLPVVRARPGVTVDDHARHLESDEHADAVGRKRDESLRRASVALAGPGIRVDLPDHE